MRARFAEELRQVLPKNFIVSTIIHFSSTVFHHMHTHTCSFPHRPSTHTHTHTACQCQGLCRPAPLYLHEAIMASVAAPFVSAVPRPCSPLVPISWLLAHWPHRSTLCCPTRKIQKTPSSTSALVTLPHQSDT